MAAASAPHLIGREPERRALDESLTLAENGIGRLVVLTGDAGIGKTALAEASVIDARTRGFATAWASCSQVDSVAPLLPWTQLISQLGGHDSGPDLAVDFTDPDAGRIEQSRRVVEWLRSMAGTPTLLVLDDLHWADSATLRVLLHVAVMVTSIPVVVVGTHRSFAIGDQPLNDIEDQLFGLAEVIEIRGLDADAAEALVSGVTGRRIGRDLGTSLVDLTGGNPLFLRELSRLVDPDLLQRGVDLAELAIPSALKRVLVERLSSVGGPCRRLLDAMAAVGDDVPLDLLAEVCDVDVVTAFDLADEAARAGLARLDQRTISFPHALYRTAAYASLSSAERFRLHDRIGRELLARRERGLIVSSAALAHHLAGASPLGYTASAFRFAIEAAREAEAMLSFDLAVRRYDQALAMLQLDPGLGDPRQVMLGLADACIAVGDNSRGRELFRAAARHATDEGDAETLGRAALGFSGGLGGIEVAVGDAEACSLLARASSALQEDDVLGAKVDARWSVALTYSASLGERRAIADRARERALAGGDPAAIAECLAAWCDVAAGPALLDERRSAGATIVEHGAALGDLRIEALGRRLLVEALFEAGELRQAEREIARYEHAAAQLGRSEYRWYGGLWRGALALVRAQREVWLETWAELQPLLDIGGPNAGLLGTVQSVTIALDLADKDLARQSLQEVLASVSVTDDVQLGVSVALLRAIDGDVDAASSSLDALVGGALAAQPDSEWPPLMLQLSELIALCGGHDRATDLRRRMEPFGSIWAIEGIGAGIRGPLDRGLGLLAAVSGDHRAARAHLAAARLAAAQAGAALTVGLVDHDMGVLLGDEDAAGRAARRWRELGAVHRLAQLEARGSARPAHSATPAAAMNTFVRSGDVWSIVFGGRTCTLGDRKGLRDLARLLAQPGRDIAALDLMSPGPTLFESDTGEIIDATARAAYRRRLAEIESELDDADRNGDIARSEQLGAEHDALMDQLTSAHGIGGRTRRTGSSAERARTAVRSRLRDAMAKLEEVHPALGRHLRRSVRTGTFCVYDPDTPVRWSVEDRSHTV